MKKALTLQHMVKWVDNFKHQEQLEMTDASLVELLFNEGYNALKLMHSPVMYSHITYKQVVFYCAPSFKIMSPWTNTATLCNLSDTDILCETSNMVPISERPSWPNEKTRKAPYYGEVDS